MDEEVRIAVSVVCADPRGVFDAALFLPRGATVADAIEQSGIRKARPDVDIRPEWIGIFARKVSLEALLRDGDRVEIYRPLKVDPKEARRKRARGD
jgi:putative ubiquitin-RnfH superfamily antitoxin RatB of RatAB toxin-antitoxin module